MTVIKGCVIALVALAAGALTEAARADEAYICDAGRVVYVKPGELEIKKLQDPCIAKYFEQTPAAKPVSRQAEPVAALAVTPRPAEPVSADYRNVRIINAAPGADAWFRHRH